MKHIIANICRFLLAFTFLFSGFVKANDPFGMSYKIDDYFTGFGIGFDGSSQWALLLAVLLATIEFSIGLCLLLAVGRRWVAKITFVFVILLTLLTVYIYFADPVEDCGCFGDVITLTNGQTLLKNIVILALSAVLLKYYTQVSLLFSVTIRKVLFGISVCIPLTLSWYTIVNLPLIDFRPFKVGTDMMERVQLPEVTDADIKVARYNALGLCFQDINTEDDVTDQLFEATGRVTLVVSYDVSVLDESHLQTISAMYDEAMKKGEQFALLTASDAKSVESWQGESCNFPVYVSDDRTLKTIIRANPGVVTLQDGVIVDKTPM